MSLATTEPTKISIESISPSYVKELNGKTIRCYDEMGENIDETTVRSFGEEWKSFHDFKEEEIQQIGQSYFDIVTPDMMGKDKIAADFGCGTGRWTKYIHDKFGVIAAIDPSDAIFTASKLLIDVKNVQLFKASIDALPFQDNTFDFGFSLGVLHHIPDTLKAMKACVDKLKPGGYFLVYLYYSLDNRGFLYRSIFHISNTIRKIVSRLPQGLKRFVCDIFAIFFYMPFVLLVRLLKTLGASKQFRNRFPLYSYENTSFYIIRNDSLDRFGTPLEQRFSKQQIREMMLGAGLENIIFSDALPYWHAIGKKK